MEVGNFASSRVFFSCPVAAVLRSISPFFHFAKTAIIITIIIRAIITTTPPPPPPLPSPSPLLPTPPPRQ